MRKGDRIIISFVLVLTLLVSAFFQSGLVLAEDNIVTSQKQTAFSDISEHWAEKDIMDAVESGFVKGYTDGTFKPNKAVTRAEFVSMVNNALKLRDTNIVELSFTDINSTDWYNKEIQKASYAKYVGGVSATVFSPNANIKRQEAAAMLGRFLPKAGYEQQTILESFPDYANVSDWAKKSLAVVINKGYMNGHANGNLSALGTLTRAEAATIITKLLKGETIISDDITVSKSGDILRDNIYVGDITITKSVGEGDATLQNLSALSKVYVLGGGANTVTIDNSLIIKLIVSKEGTKVRVMSSGDTSIYETMIFNNNTLVDEDGDGVEPGEAGFENIIRIEGTVSSDDAKKITDYLASILDSTGTITKEQVAASVEKVLKNTTTTVAADGSIVVTVENTPNTNEYSTSNITRNNVIYNANGGTGSQVDAGLYKLDQVVTVKDQGTITRTGYNFLGWSSLPDGNGTFYSPGSTFAMPRNDKVLYAKWEPIDYLITYNLDDGTNGANPTSYNIETATINLADATKTGYQFAGWWDAATGGNQVDSITLGSIGNNALYARWTPNTNTAYKVEHYQQNITGSGYTLKDTDNLTGTTATVANAIAKDYTGFTENISHASRVSIGTIARDGSLVLKLYYDRNTFTVSYNSNEGSSVSSNTGIRYGSLISAPTAPTKEGCVLVGWYKDAGLTDVWNFGTDTVTTTTTLYAKWELRAATKIVISGPSSVVAGVTSGNFTLNTTDDDGNVAFVDGDTAFILTSNSTGTVTFSSSAVTIPEGQSSVTFTYSDTQSGLKTVTATYDIGDSGLLNKSDTHQITVNPAAISSLTIQQQPVDTMINSAISPAITVLGKDVYNNSVQSGQNIEASLLSGTGTLSGTTTRVTDTNGIATFDTLKIDTAGTKTIRFTANTGSVDSDEFDVLVSCPTSQFYGILLEYDITASTARYQLGDGNVIDVENHYKCCSQIGKPANVYKQSSGTTWISCGYSYNSYNGGMTTGVCYASDTPNKVKINTTEYDIPSYGVVCFNQSTNSIVNISELEGVNVTVYFDSLGRVALLIRY